MAGLSFFCSGGWTKGCTDAPEDGNPPGNGGFEFQLKLRLWLDVGGSKPGNQATTLGSLLAAGAVIGLTAGVGRET